MNDPGLSGTASAPAERQPHRCPVCDADRVYPTYWRYVDDNTRYLELRCPDCGAQRAVVLDREVADAFNTLLHRSSEQLAQQAEELRRQCALADEARFAEFVAALERDLILPMDF